MPLRGTVVACGLFVCLFGCSGGEGHDQGPSAGAGGEAGASAGQGGRAGSVAGRAGGGFVAGSPAGAAGSSGGGNAGTGGTGAATEVDAGAPPNAEPPSTPPPLGAETWVGEFGGGPHHNASAFDVAPTNLEVAWRRTFRDVVRDGQWDPGSYSNQNIPAGKGSQNLALVDGKLALIAKDGTGPTPYRGNTGYLTILDAGSGRTQNCLAILLNRGNVRVYGWPRLVSMGTDSAPSIGSIQWDPQSKILFTGIGAYNISYSAYLPLANTGTHEAGRCQTGVAAFQEQVSKSPGLQDAFGRTRAELASTIGPDRSGPKPMQPHLWGMSGVYGLDGTGSEDTDWRSLYGSTAKFYNSSSFMRVDPRGDLIGITVGGGSFGHGGSLAALLFSKHSGLKAINQRPQTTVLTTPPYPRGTPSQLHPWATRGAILYDGHVYMSGPGDDTFGASGSLADGRGADQGLYLWAYRYRMADRRANDGHDGPAANETAELQLLWSHRFVSANTTASDDNHDSWHEDDGYRRNKAMLVDDGVAWMGWKASRAAGVELVRAGAAGKATFDLGIGQGLIGEDLWGKIGLARLDGRKVIVFYTGHARSRGRSSATWEGPRGPAGLAAFDVASGKVLWRYEISTKHPTLPANGSWTQIDRSQMVVAGRWAYVGWVDTSGANAALRLLAFDVTAAEPQPKESVIELGFPGAANRDSALFDLIAANGRLYALVYQASEMELDSPTPKMAWSAQHVLALHAP